MTQQKFLMLNPRRRRDPEPEIQLLFHLKVYGDVTQTSEWGSFFNYLSINRYTAIFISCAAFADEYEQWARDFRRVHPHQPIILFTSKGEFDVRILKSTSKIFSILRIDKLEVSMASCMERLEKYHLLARSLKSRRSKDLLGPRGFGDFVGNSLSMNELYRQLTRVASSDYTVLIAGESGTGKEVVARTIHQLSERSSNPYISINCAAIPENLLESELFGYEKGAFTGANQTKAGKFELAHTGTLFLDEIGDMPMGLQVKLLRVLEDGKIQPLGGVQEKQVDIRLITATHKNLTDQISKGLFRDDLHYRLNVIPLAVPPLRSRIDDLTLLVLFFLAKLLKGEDQTIQKVSWDLVDTLAELELAGNVRELENILTRSVFHTDGVTLSHDTLVTEEPVQKGASQIDEDSNMEHPIRPLWEVEKETLQNALSILNGNISQAANQLQISRAAIYRKIKKYGLQESDDLDAQEDEHA